MSLHAIHFVRDLARIYRREGSVSAPPVTVSRSALPAEQGQNWDITTAALAGLLNAGESVLAVEINPAPPVPTAFQTVTVEDGNRQEPTAWRDTLRVMVSVRTADRGHRSISLTTEQFTSAPARTALLALWAHLAA